MSIKHIYHYAALQQGPEGSINYSDGINWTDKRVITSADYINFKARVHSNMAGTGPCTLTSLTYLYTEDIADEDM